MSYSSSFSASEFREVALLGSGTQGKTYLMQDRNDNFLCGKLIDRGNENPSPEAELVHKRLSSPFIVPIYYCVPKNRDLLLIMQYCSGGCLHEFATTESLTPADIWIITTQLVHGLKYLHDRSIIHRDLKPSNVVLCSKDRPLRVKICDFGISRDLREQCAKTSIGTLYFMAPEVHHEIDYGTPADMWSLGVLIYFLVHKTYPFQTVPEVLSGQVPVSTSEFGPLISRLLVSDPYKRATASDLVNFPQIGFIFKKFFDESSTDTFSNTSVTGLKAIISEQSKMISSLQERNRTIEAQFSDSISRLTGQLSGTTICNDSNRRISELEAELQRITKLYEELHKTNKQLVTRNQLLVTEKRNLEVDYTKKSNQLNTYQERLKVEYQEKTNRQAVEANRLSNRIIELEREKQELSIQLQQLSTELQQSKNPSKAIESRFVQEKQQLLDRIQTLHNNNLKTIQERDARINQLEQQLTSVQSCTVRDNSTVSRHLVDSLSNGLEKWKQKSHEQQTIITNLKQELEQTNLQLSKANEEVTVVKQQLNQRHENNQLSSLSRNRNQQPLIESCHDYSTSQLESLSHHNSLFVLSGLSCLTTAKKQCGELRQLDSSQIVFFTDMFFQAIEASKNKTLLTAANHFKNNQHSQCLASLDPRFIADNEYMIAESLVLVLLCSSEIIPAWFFTLLQRLQSVFYKNIVFDVLVEFCRNKFLAEPTSSALTKTSLTNFIQQTRKNFAHESNIVRLFRDFLYPSIPQFSKQDVSSLMFQLLDFRPDLNDKQIEVTLVFKTIDASSPLEFMVEKGFRSGLSLKFDYREQFFDGNRKVFLLNNSEMQLHDLIRSKKKLLIKIRQQGRPIDLLVPFDQFKNNSHLVHDTPHLKISCVIRHKTNISNELKNALESLV
ncbi:hypothetical protein RCL1_003934 [Eukaryota sp. TZLM3-RCL]